MRNQGDRRWLKTVDQWVSVEADLLERFHVDMWQSGWDMPWPKLQNLIRGLLQTPAGFNGYQTRLQDLLVPKETK